MDYLYHQYSIFRVNIELIPHIYDASADRV